MLKPYYQKANFTLYQADTLDFLKEFPENSIDMIFADPPYFLSSGSFSCQNGKMVSVKKGNWDLSNGLKKNFEFHNEWIKECRRVLKPNGTIWISGTYHSIYQCGFALQVNKFHILNDIAWFKPNASPNLSCRFFTASHETLIWARKDKKAKHIFNYGDMKNGEWPEDVLKKPNKQMRSVWSINTPKREEKVFGKHPTQKSLDLLRRIVLASTNKGDLILDPFTGSSTTGIAANMYGRNFIGIDTKKEYLDVSIKRFEELEKNIINNIPSYVCSWTDRYFHQSAFDEPLKSPNNNIVKYLSKFRPSEKVKLYRGKHKFNNKNYTGIESWTYDSKVAIRYAKIEKNGSVEEKEFLPKDILLDTTLLNNNEKKYFGYDYHLDDKEVLVFKKQL